MDLKAIASEIATGRAGLLRRVSQARDGAYRVSFLSALLASGLLSALSGDGLTFEEIAGPLGCRSDMEGALEAWLRLGVALGLLRNAGGRYQLACFLAAGLAEPGADPIAAMAQEIPSAQTVILDVPARIRSGSRFSLSEQPNELVVRGSRLLEKLACSALNSVVPRVGAYRVLDVGCGAGGYLKYAAERNPRLSGLGVEQDERAAALAHDCLQAWQLDGRISIQTANIEAISPGEDFDLAMLHLIVAYVAAEKRTEFLRHVRAFLKPGGTILISNQVRPAKPTGEDVQLEWLNLWGLMTYAGGPVPVEGEIEKSLSEAGYVSIAAKRLIPLTRFASITAKKPCSSD